MIPDKTSEVWRLLVTGQKEYRFQLIPASMMLARVIRSVQLNNSPENIEKCISELYTFFIHYQAILNKDIQSLFGLSTTVSPTTTNRATSLGALNLSSNNTTSQSNASRVAQ